MENRAQAIPGGLFDDEHFWRDHQEWLAKSGYTLRPRYGKDWVPSWLMSKRNPDDCEDGQATMRTVVMDAVREADRQVVSLKKVSKREHPQEEEIIRYFSRPPRADDSSNHSVPAYAVLQSPLDENILFLVMPYLVRINDVKFATIGEVVECLRQLFEGLRFIHRHNVAHCDIHVMNVMMEPGPLFSSLPHPTDHHRSYHDFTKRTKQYTRTGHPTRYYYIDFGLSYKFGDQDPFPRIQVAFGGDKSVPEYRADPQSPKDPYKIDVYCLGNLIRKDLIEKASGFEFLRPLVDDMVQREPSKRPSMEVAYRGFEELRATLTQRQLRSRVVYRSELPIARLYRDCRHLFRTLGWLATGTPALPTPHTPAPPTPP